MVTKALQNPKSYFNWILVELVDCMTNATKLWELKLAMFQVFDFLSSYGFAY